MAEKRIGKSTLSMYLRTMCDRELFLSLHKQGALERSGMPVPLRARPGIGVLQTAGRELEEERNSQLTEAFGDRVIYRPGTNGNPGQVPLEGLLDEVADAPSILLQGMFEVRTFQDDVMRNIGLSAEEASLIPPISGLVPDIVVVREPGLGDEEVGPDGSRRFVDAENEERLALSIIDVKHTGEANPNYCAEIALYALFLSNWLTERGLQNRFFVTVRSYLWTRLRQGQAALDLLMENGAAVTPADYLEALIADCEDANLRFYLPAVTHFFREDLPRVIAVGDSDPDGWRNLEWHVDGRCAACDWLGHEGWLGSNDRARVRANPEHYCHAAAALTRHLSLIPGMTRGARKTLENHDIVDTASAATTSSGHKAFQEHSHLKKERSRIPRRAVSLESSTMSLDDSAILSTLAPGPQLHVAVSVNFDPSAGLLAGLSLMGRVTAYVQGQTPGYFRPRSFVVDRKSFDDEWTALEGLLSALADIVDRAEAFVVAAGGNPLTAQVAFWEKRQFDELCAAMGRHLPQVLSLVNRRERALAWLFPADELLERSDGAVSPCVVFVDEIVRRVVFAPTPHVITLLDTAEIYYSGRAPIRQHDSFYREFLTNGIPRERIFEVWSGAATITRGVVVLPRNTVIQEYANALERQSLALHSVVERLRRDFRGQLRANAPRLVLSVPQGARGVAFDSKLWIWWEQLQYQTRRLESHRRLALDSETMEANYEAVRLTSGAPTGQPGEFAFDVLPTSTEAKLDDGDGFLVLGSDNLPGLPLDRAIDIVDSASPVFQGTGSPLRVPLWASLAVTLRTFDRAGRRAVIELSNFRDPAFVPYLVAHSTVDLMNDVFITEGQQGFKWYEKVHSILGAVGNPAIAVADPVAAAAMGMAPTTSASDPATPLARVLWQPHVEQARLILSADESQGIADYVRDQTRHGLNESQAAAVAYAARHGLSIVWGPPGTGKTKTLAACIHGLVHDAVLGNRPLKLLIAGPTYKAVEELVDRVVDALDADVTSPAELYIGYSRSQEPRPYAAGGTHLRVTPFILNFDNQETQDCLAGLRSDEGVTLVATTTMQAYKLSEWIHGSCVGPIFDVVILDESSQIEVTKAISPLATMKDDFRLVVAGDRLQMPPIMALEPPVGAEYLVGSVQTYLLTRDFGHEVSECPLEENYRSAEDIVAYARTIGYRRSLTSVYPDTALHLLSPIPTPATDFPESLPWSELWERILAPETKVMTLLHEDELSSQGNRFEAGIVAALVWCLRQSVSAVLDGRGSVEHASPTPEEFWGRCVGIVTPHRAQRALVVRELRAVFPEDPLDLINSAVDTVEKFQGGERHTILVSFGVGDADVIMGEEAFLMQLERTNVAISRAMAKCCLFRPD